MTYPSVYPGLYPATGPAVAQQVTGANVQDYGIGTTMISTTAGSAIIVFAGWMLASASFHGPVQAPAVTVTDSAGNVWRQLALSPASAPQGLRCAVWAAFNAQPVSWVSVSLTGFADATAWTVTEVSGLPAAVSVDFTAGTTGTTAAAGTSGTTSAADAGFTVIAALDTGYTVTPPAGWTALTTEYAFAGPSSLTVYPFWTPSLAAGVTASGVATFSPGTVWSAALATVTLAAAAPAQYTPYFPRVVTEAAFGAQPGLISASTDWTAGPEHIGWTDISGYAIGEAGSAKISASRGRQYELSQEEAGQLTVWLDNHAGAFTPSNPGSPFYSNAINANMSFQSGTSPWVSLSGMTLTSSAAFTFASAPLAVSAASMELTPDGITASPSAISTGIPVNVNYPYTASFWIYSPGGWPDGAYAAISWLNSSGGFTGGNAGTPVPLTAGTWTQCTVTAATLPSATVSAWLVVNLSGTPSSSQVFYVAEAALVAGTAPVVTGLITPEVPVRVTCWWQGRQYAIWQGYAERWALSWPDMPQWGMCQLTAADAAGVIAAGTMASALEGEMLIDNPVVYLPCDEQYTTATTGSNTAFPFFFGNSPYFAPADANGLTAINDAFGNPVTGIYFDGLSVQVDTGLTLALQGDSGTGMGATGYSGAQTGQRGPGLIYFADPALTAVASGTAFTIGFWVVYTGTANVTLLTLYGPPSSFWARSGENNGASLIVNADPIALQVTGVTNVTCSITPSPAPMHVVISFASGFSYLYVNGVLRANSTYTVLPGLNAIGVGPGRYSYDNRPVTGTNNGYNYVAGRLGVYSYYLPPNRVQAHYEAGAAGWQGVSAAYRFAQILTWAGLGLKRGGYWQASATGNPEFTQMTAAYNLAGSSAADAENQVAQSEGGAWMVQANGTLIYVERQGAYNIAPSAALGDNPPAEVPYLQDVEADTDNTHLYNEIIATQANGPNNLITVDNRNPASQQAFFRRSALSYQPQVVSPYDVSDITTWSLALYSSPVQHVAGVTVDVASNPLNAFGAVLGLELGDVVTFARRPTGGAPVTETGIVERVEHDIGPGYWQVTYQISPQPPRGSVLAPGIPGFQNPSATTLGW